MYILAGAIQAGLKQEYIDNLKAIPTYAPDEETLARRAALPAPEDLPPMTVDELAKHNGKSEEQLPIHVAVLGYVFDCQCYYPSHNGRDLTTHLLLQVGTHINFWGFTSAYACIHKASFFSIN